eukprot:scaffold107175_cov44-Cyclotella_meneghiniana.AAC.2
MTPPPPTPQHHHDMLVDAITRGATSQTPAPHVAAPAAPPSSPVSALKRHSSHERDGTVSGVSSPANKRTDARPTPIRRIRFAQNLPTPMQIEPPDVTAIFNNHCQYCFMYCMSEFQDYSLPLMLEEDWNRRAFKQTCFLMQ